MIEQNGQRINDLMREFDQFKSVRANWESYWADIARRIHPDANVFMRPLQGLSAAERRTDFIFESTPVQALESFSAVVENLMTPRPTQWVKLSPPHPSLEQNQNVRIYLEGMNEIMRGARYQPRANFASQTHECYKELGAFGTMALFIDEAPGQHLQYRACPLADIFIGLNNVGYVDRVFRQFEFTATQACEEWGEENLPPQVVMAYNNPGQNQRKFNFLHCVRPRKDAEYGRLDARGMPFESYHICTDPKWIIEEGGYRTFPYPISRYTTRAREVYGASPAMIALADIKMLNEMSRTDMNAAQLVAEPAILLAEEINGFSFRPHALNYGSVSRDGKPMALPFNGGGQPEITEEKMQKRRDSINMAFLTGNASIMQLIMENPTMQPTTVMQILQERGALLTPIMGRQQSEFLGPIITREIDILAHAGAFDALGEMPPELVAAGGYVKIEYTSPLAQMQRAGEGVAILTTLQQLAPIAAVDPSIYKRFDLDGIAKKLALVNGMDDKLVRSDEQMAQIRAEDAQAAQIQALVAASPQLASAAKDAAQAHATMSTPPPQ